jgi:hypothetical protein
MAAAGFFALPAMPTIMFQDFKETGGLAQGVSRGLMTLVSTGCSVVVSSPAVFGADHSHSHTPRLLLALAVVIGLCELFFWFIYCPWKAGADKKKKLDQGED